ncbi:UNVERIFIED_CONTAM: hypothetical protein FKN15_022708 [Acipenser sinensis]
MTRLICHKSLPECFGKGIAYRNDSQGEPRESDLANYSLARRSLTCYVVIIDIHHEALGMVNDGNIGSGGDAAGLVSRTSIITKPDRVTLSWNNYTKTRTQDNFTCNVCGRHTVATGTAEKHYLLLEEVLDLMEHAALKLNLKKAALMKSSVCFLGVQIHHEALGMVNDGNIGSGGDAAGLVSRTSIITKPDRVTLSWNNYTKTRTQDNFTCNECFGKGIAYRNDSQGEPRESDLANYSLARRSLTCYVVIIDIHHEALGMVNDGNIGSGGDAAGLVSRTSIITKPDRVTLSWNNYTKTRTQDNFTCNECFGKGIAYRNDSQGEPRESDLANYSLARRSLTCYVVIIDIHHEALGMVNDGNIGSGGDAAGLVSRTSIITKPDRVTLSWNNYTKTRTQDNFTCNECFGKGIAYRNDSQGEPRESDLANYSLARRSLTCYVVIIDIHHEALGMVNDGNIGSGGDAAGLVSRTSIITKPDRVTLSWNNYTKTRTQDNFTCNGSRGSPDLLGRIHHEALGMVNDGNIGSGGDAAGLVSRTSIITKPDRVTLSWNNYTKTRTQDNFTCNGNTKCSFANVTGTLWCCNGTTIAKCGL